MTEPKEGYEAEHKEAIEEVEMLEAWLEELHSTRAESTIEIQKYATIMNNLKDTQDAVRLVQALLEGAEDSIRRSMGRGIAPEDKSMYLRALCSDVKKAAKMLGDIVEK